MNIPSLKVKVTAGILKSKLILVNNLSTIGFEGLATDHVASE
jgi:hypothetical protein